LAVIKKCRLSIFIRQSTQKYNKTVVQYTDKKRYNTTKKQKKNTSHFKTYNDRLCEHDSLRLNDNFLRLYATV